MMTSSSIRDPSDRHTPSQVFTNLDANVGQFLDSLMGKELVGESSGLLDKLESARHRLASVSNLCTVYRNFLLTANSSTVLSEVEKVIHAAGPDGMPSLPPCMIMDLAMIESFAHAEREDFESVHKLLGCDMETLKDPAEVQEYVYGRLLVRLMRRDSCPDTSCAKQRLVALFAPLLGVKVGDPDEDEEHDVPTGNGAEEADEMYDPLGEMCLEMGGDVADCAGGLSPEPKELEPQLLSPSLKPVALQLLHVASPDAFDVQDVQESLDKFNQPISESTHGWIQSFLAQTVGREVISMAEQSVRDKVAQKRLLQGARVSVPKVKDFLTECQSLENIWDHMAWTKGDVSEAMLAFVIAIGEAQFHDHVTNVTRCMDEVVSLGSSCFTGKVKQEVAGLHKDRDLNQGAFVRVVPLVLVQRESATSDAQCLESYSYFDMTCDSYTIQAACSFAPVDLCTGYHSQQQHKDHHSVDILHRTRSASTTM
jgi:hypothetical protein